MTAIEFRKVRDGRYVELSTGIELARGIDDSDGYDRIEWTIWTARLGYPLGCRDSLNAAKTRTRELIAPRSISRAPEGGRA